MTSFRMNTPALPPRTKRLVSARGAFVSQRAARSKHSLWLFYLEHNLIQEAQTARTLMLQDLRSARSLWRTALGID